MSITDPELYFAEDGAPRSGRFGDIYYSLQDGLSEARAVFLTGCGMPEIWGGRTDFTLLELGFGTGLNIAAVMELWSKTRPAGGYLHIFSVEGFLMNADEAARALGAWPELREFTGALLAQWPKARRGFHHMEFPQWGVSLTLGLMDVRAALSAWEGAADAVFLDGFSPALNPDMWGEDVMALIAARTRPGASLATFTVAGFVRRGLQAAGFSVEKRPGFGRKRERLEAIRSGEAVEAKRPGRIAIIGAGIAGCALYWQARQLGVSADIFDASEPGAGASGNPAALVTPRLDAGDNDISALFADAFSYAIALYHRLCPQAILGEGVRLCADAPKAVERFTRIAGQAGFAAGDLEVFGKGAAQDLPESEGLHLKTALHVEPQTVLKALLGGHEPIRERILGYDRAEDGLIRLKTEDGRSLAGYDRIILACGEGLFDMPEAGPAELRAVRGQVEQVADKVPLAEGLSWGGYAIPLNDGFLFGATHERNDRASDIRDASRAYNLASLSAVMPERAARIAAGPFQSRASIRVTTRDYLPVAGSVEAGIYLFTGLGARGFCLAPLLAKSLLNDIIGVPSVLPRGMKKSLGPERFLRTSNL
ncbi:MAG: tRNA (5-methylaminomethyl-2-thiouridine)(34)-methyltransferase MnmD [Asticcacaulis sp.]|uniref:tRNA (5-methylaminomethyl-2-thiouridine)(34)-methyltransferase MnmD n=1 Tax=Asticcacaulis sp. TaxID=1872648 RepID=UPI0039E70E7A